ncbi:hypothetical protein F2Q70_00017453 [Brassica cretica]|uniref:Uncharacterized protein n=1 Tax=Brassica cretica TaxID=69181 RepID=A0A8S9I3P8_BRACR|nr:hypothetical protein F2Q70_00017453 [Brassica cretica]
MRLHISVPNKKSVMVNLGHSKLWAESGMVAKLKVKYMEVTGAGVQNWEFWSKNRVAFEKRGKRSGRWLCFVEFDPVVSAKASAHEFQAIDRLDLLLDVALSIPRARFDVDVSSVAAQRRRRRRRFVTTPVAREETTARNGEAGTAEMESTRDAETKKMKT